MWKTKQCTEIEETAVFWGNRVKLHWSKEISGNLCKFIQQQQNSTLDITISNCVFSAELDSRMFAYLYLVFLYYKNLSQFIIKNMKDESFWEVILNEVFLLLHE